MPLAFPAPARASSAHPSLQQQRRQRDSPSPTKKRRVETGSDAGSVPRAGPFGVDAQGHRTYGMQRSPASRVRPRARTVAAELDTEADPNDPELQSRLHSSTLKLRDAWDDILRRHSLPAPSPPGSSRSASRAEAQARRHRPAGRTRAIPVEEDDIIDLATMEIVEDRGVLRRSRAGAFALGGYMDALDDVIVGPDTGVGAAGEDDAGSGSGAEHGGAGGDSFEEEEDEDADAWSDEAYGDSSEDELGDMDELPSLPSLVFREQRRRDAERRDQLRDFWEQEARARGASDAASALGEAAAADVRGNRTIEAVQQADDDDELSFFAPAPSPGPASPALPFRRASSSPLRVDFATPSRKGKSAAHAPSTTAVLRQGVATFQLESSSPARPPASSPSHVAWQRALTAAPPPPARSSAPGSSPLKHGSACLTCRKRKRRCDATRPTCGPCGRVGSSRDASEACGYDRESSPDRALSMSAPRSREGLPTPPTSFAAAAAKASMPPIKALTSSRPPLSSSPLREVITVASPTPTPEPFSPTSSSSPSPASPDRDERSPSLEILPARPRQRSPSSELGLEPTRAVSPELGLPAPEAPEQSPALRSQLLRQNTYQHPTPTPTPPPAPAPDAIAASGSSPPADEQPQKQAKPTPPKKREWRRHSFEIVIERKPSRASMTPRPLGAAAGGREEQRDKPAADEDATMRSPAGLSTPPLSKRAERPPSGTTTAAAARSSRRSTGPPAAVPRAAGAGPAAATARAPKALPSRILPRPVAFGPSAKRHEDGDEADAQAVDDDPLLLESPSPVKRSGSPAPRRRGATETPVPRRTSSGKRRLSTVAPLEEDDPEGEDDADDDFGTW